MTKSPIQRRKHKQKLLAYVICTIIGIVLSIAAYLYFFASPKVNPPLGEDLCPTGFPPAAYYAILIDTTDPYNTIQRAFIKKHLSAWRDQLPQFSKINVFAVSDAQKDILSPKLSVCNPGKAANPLIQNPERIRVRWEEMFVKPFDELVDNLVNCTSEPRSPIMEMIQAVSISTFPENSMGVPKGLIIISDMLHNTEEYSHYQEAILVFEDFKKSTYFSRVRTDMSEVAVTILYARRDGAEAERVQGRGHARFWDEYFATSGGTVTLIKKIPG